MGMVLNMKPTDESNRSINHFRAWRKWHNEMTLVDLAIALGKQPSWSGNLSRLERGLQGWSQGTLQTIADVHGVKPEALLNPPPPGSKRSAVSELDAAAVTIVAESLDVDESHILYCYRKMTSSSRRYVYHLCGDLQLLGDSAPDPFAMRGLVNFLPIANSAGASDEPKNNPLPAREKV